MPDELSAKLKEIEAVLLEEREALRRLDTDGIESTAARKLVLADALAEARHKGEATAEDRTLLSRIRDLAAANQILLVHARTCIRGAIEAVTGQPIDGYPKARASTAVATMGSLRVDVRG